MTKPTATVRKMVSSGFPRGRDEVFHRVSSTSHEKDHGVPTTQKTRRQKAVVSAPSRYSSPCVR